MRCKTIIAGFLFWLIPVAVLWAADDVSVSALVDRTTVALGESLQFTVTITGGDGEVDTRPITDFKVVKRGTSTSIQYINGNLSRGVTAAYVLIPKKAGKLTIPALSVDVDGNIHPTEPITITVTGQTADDPQTQAYDIWVAASVSEAKPFVGQQVTYTFRLYHAVQVGDATFQPPEFDGFSASEIKERNSLRRIINGREYGVTEVFYVLTPLLAGAQRIEPAVLNVGIVRRQSPRSRSPFDSLFGDPFFSHGVLEPSVLQTEPIEMEVQPLPPYPDRNTDPFSGLVGRFELKAAVEPTVLAVGGSATVTLTIEGQGNLMDASAPALQLPPQFKAYADAPQEQIQQDVSGTSGQKIFRTAVVPVQPGRFELPPVRLTYFDVARKAYRTVTSEPLGLQVHASETAEAAPPAPSVGLPATGRLKKKVEFTGHDILPLKESLDAIEPQRAMSARLFLMWILAPAIAFAVVGLIRRLRRKEAGPAARMKARAHAQIKAAAKAGQDRDLFLTHLYQAMIAAICAAAGRTSQALTWKEAENLLLQSGLNAREAQMAADLLARIESSKFSGASLDAAQRNELLEQSQSMIRTLVAS